MRAKAVEAGRRRSKGVLPVPPGFVVALILALAGGTLAAQDTVNVIDPNAPALPPVLRGGPPDSVVREAVGYHNDSTVTRVFGSFTIASGTGVRGNLAMFRGTLRVLGRIEGRVTVINGSLIIGTGAEVAGDILLMGGRLQIQPGGRHTGASRTFADPAPVFRNSAGLLEVRARAPTPGGIASVGRSFQAGKLRTTLSLETARTYNRVEGLPVRVGPTFSFPTPNRGEARFDFRAVLRTESDHTDRREPIGFLARAEWESRGPTRGGIGGIWSRTVNPIEDQPLSLAEVGWSTFLFGRDYRDYYEQQGAGGYVFVYPLRWLRLEASARVQKETSVPASDPVALADPDLWRPNPLIDDGHFTLIRGRIDVDTRNNTITPTSGWLVQAWYERGTSKDVAPITLPVEVRQPIPTFRDYHFQRIGFDARKYARINAISRVNLRVAGGGWVGGDPLPVQRRLSLGGPDLLAGYGFRDQTCAPFGFTDPAQTALCDRMLTAQAELRFRFRLPLREKLASQEWLVLERLFGRDYADIVLFGDMGKAWLTGDGPGRIPNYKLPVLREFSYDAGIGLDIDGLALYVATPLGDRWDPRLTLRIQRRF
ncbi:MAG TPA: BamA/TamA family outer membrane protein [Gemmatimonadales bacterium]